jgi:uncharacterized membrane protein YbhN (UPF0104 family)
MKKKIKSFILFLARVIISFGLLFYLLKKTEWDKLFLVLKNLSPIYYVLAFACVLSFQTLVALRWKKICEVWGFKKPLSFYLKSYLMSLSLNTVFPGIVAGDTLRAGLLIKEGLHWKKASMSLLFDRGYGLFGIIVILSFSLPLYGDFLPQSFKQTLFLIIYSAILGFFLINLLGKKFFPKIQNPEALKPLFFPQNLIPIVLGFVVQVFFVLQYVFLSKALFLSLPLRVLFVVIPIVSFLSALPLSISGLGVREGTLSYFLHLLGYPLEYGVALGLLGYSLILVSAIPGISLYLTKRWK